jgi:hypothetical protein
MRAPAEDLPGPAPTWAEINERWASPYDARARHSEKGS